MVEYYNVYQCVQRTGTDGEPLDGVEPAGVGRSVETVETVESEKTEKGHYERRTLSTYTNF